VEYDSGEKREREEEERGGGGGGGDDVATPSLASYPRSRLGLADLAKPCSAPFCNALSSLL
jgi:hypothetical protein